MLLSPLTGQDRTEVERLVDLAHERVINGKTITKQVKNADTPSHHDILTLFDEFAGVFPDNLLWAFQFLAKPIITLIWWNMKKSPRIGSTAYPPRKRSNTRDSLFPC